MVTMRAVHVAVLGFLVGRGTHRCDRAEETQRHSGKRMIAVDHDFFSAISVTV
jgi:hypothetical protein